MRHFSFLSDDYRSRLFHRQPVELTTASPARLLSTALGATLYTPGDRPDLAGSVIRQTARGAISMVLCLEDSIADDVVPMAEDNVVQALRDLDGRDGLPLLFVRVRTAAQITMLAERAGDAIGSLAGFVVPKFHNDDGYGQDFLDALHEVQSARPARAGSLRIMPILESPAMIHAESRTRVLSDIASLLQANRDDVLAVRIGTTDLSSVFGLRRSRDLTIYDVNVVASVIGDIVNILGRGSDGFTITGPVWEHYADTERLLRPQLRLTPFAEAHEENLRRQLLVKNYDGLLREITLDHANGLLGKTVIHPSHVPLVHALSVISHEEYLDAVAITAPGSAGVAASPYRNKMNEMKPHQMWAEKTLLRADAFGVASPEATFVDFLEASML
ncbi:HpcH/HpaI aldolase/citrate lyase family protein [Frondihabitans sp. Leaf304]|uniref:HpcH/HpaI aldolase/citrate lyase family protein n=1 Tax=Frondihabitans sp. Leaf304 TaxID=1736329 RepID=UPI0006FE12FE|nr:HpcH/HpaI aldolase/citrate lyase family protein [Frondihabitans sp. Leaf304]KQQ27432.1 ATP/GTP-binding protein [Frondihabitans sp. Leaf304]